MGKYDEQNEDLHTTLTRAGITARIDYDGDEHLVEVPLPGDQDRKLVFDPTDDGCWRLDLVTAEGDWYVHTNVVEGVGAEFAAPIVTGLLGSFS